MKLALLTLSTAALASAGPITPTMVYDIPTISTSTDDFLAIFRGIPQPTRTRSTETICQPHIYCTPRQYNPPDEYLEHESEESEIAARSLANAMIPTMVPDDPPTSTSTDEPLPTTIEEEFPRYTWPSKVCAPGEPLSKYPHGCCDMTRGFCMPQFPDPPKHLEHEPEESGIAARSLADFIIPTMVPNSEMTSTPASTSTSTDKPRPTTLEEILKEWPFPACAVGGEPPFRYPRGCCDWVAGSCIPRFHDPPKYFKYVPEESEVARPK